MMQYIAGRLLYKTPFVRIVNLGVLLLDFKMRLCAYILFIKQAVASVLMETEYHVDC